jgi:signal peptidase I
MEPTSSGPQPPERDEPVVGEARAARTDTDATAADATTGPAHESGEQDGTPWWKETLILVGTALILALIIKTFFVQAFYIPSGSMENTLNVNDRILVEKVSYWFGSPQRGDIIVFKDPANWLGEEGGSKPSNTLTKALSFVGLYPEGGHLVKRVIGVGGDQVRCHDGRVQVNGVNLEESSYVTLASDACLGIWSVKVPPDHLWVLGDNRENSADSRAHLGDPGGGFIPENDVVGKVFVTVWPVDRWHFFHRPSTFNNPELDTALGLVGSGMPLGAVFLVLGPPLYRRASLRWGDPGFDDADDTSPPQPTQPLRSQPQPTQPQPTLPTSRRRTG